MDGSKVTLSAAELALAADPEVMLMKNSVIESVNALFGRLAERQSQSVRDIGPIFGSAFDTPPKISRGEKYRGLPYVILDHPRRFSGDDIFAIRTLFWWGHFFSVTLHLKGVWLERYSERIVGGQGWLSERGFHISTGRYEWEHHFGEDNYLPVSRLGAEEWKGACSRGGFARLAVRFPVSGFGEMEETLHDVFDDIVRWLPDGRGRG
jgi:hypothetical protein